MKRLLTICVTGGIVAASGLIQGCASGGAETYTLYRNSPFAAGQRVHWASFDVADSDRQYNANNCAMAARLLNANYAASARAEGKRPAVGIGFWCEAGSFKEQGAVPASFSSAFPTDV